jgi:hypothetical protein
MILSNKMLKELYKFMFNRYGETYYNINIEEVTDFPDFEKWSIIVHYGAGKLMWNTKDRRWEKL